MTKNKIKHLMELKKTIVASRRRGEVIVFTNGCFDIIHLGHIKYLKLAAGLGDKLIVAVNSDASVRRLKGSRRPIFHQQERASIVAALGCVDYVIIFGQANPLHLIKALRPDVLVKGGNWRKDDIIGKNFVESYGGRVLSADFIKGCSSSAIIEKIKKAK